MKEYKKARSRLKVRNMKVDDVPKVFHLGEELYTAKKLPLLYRTWDPYEVAHLFSSETDLSLVADIDGVIAGFCLATTIEKQNKPWRYGYLIWLGVAEDAQLSGVGRKLVEEVLRRMKSRGIRFMLVDTEEDNVGGINFFQKMGFKIRQKQTWMWKNLGKSKLSSQTIKESILSAPMYKQKKKVRTQWRIPGPETT